jgi:putative sterol carrier protein
MADVTAEFFATLARRGHEPLLERASGSVRVELADGKRTDRWVLVIERGNLAVSRRNAAADVVLRADKKLFDRIVTGKANALTAVLRGDLAATGDLRLIVIVQRLFPGPERETP